MSVVEFIFRKAGEVFNFTKDRLCLLVLLGIWKIFTTYISCTPAASYFYYYVMTQESLVCNYFNGDTGRSLLSIYLIFLQDHLLFSIFHVNTNYIFFELGLFDLQLSFYSRISVGEVSYLPASSIQLIIQYCSCSFLH